MPQKFHTLKIYKGYNGCVMSLSVERDWRFPVSLKYVCHQSDGSFGLSLRWRYRDKEGTAMAENQQNRNDQTQTNDPNTQLEEPTEGGVVVRGTPTRDPRQS
jgi:hypothetical protein